MSITDILWAALWLEFAVVIAVVVWVARNFPGAPYDKR